MAFRTVSIPRGVLALALLGTVLAAGCGPVSTGRTQAQLKGQEIKDMTLTGLDGKPVQLRPMISGKVALVDLWATWCGPCLAAVPDLQAIHNQFKDRGFTVVGVMIDQNATRIGPEFIREKLKVSYPVVMDDDGDAVGKQVMIQGIPLLLLIDKDGKVIQSFRGLTNKEILTNAIESALKGA